MTIAAATLAFLRAKAEHPDVFVVSISADSLRNWLQGRRFALFVAPDSALTRRCLRCAVKFTPDSKVFFLCPLCRADDGRCCH